MKTINIILIIISILILVGIGIGIYVIMTSKSEERKKGRKCLLEGEDIFNNRISTKDGRVISEQPKDLYCNKCDDYYYKDKGGCVKLEFNKDENILQGDTGVCTVGLGAFRACPF